MPSTPPPCTLNYSSPTEGSGGQRIWGYHVVSKGGGRGGISRRWQSVKEGDRRNLTASKKGGGLSEYYRASRGGGETGKFKLKFSDPLPSLLLGDNKWSLRRIQM